MSVCYQQLVKDRQECLVPCSGLYVDVQYLEDSSAVLKETHHGIFGSELVHLMEQYQNYRKGYVNNVEFDPAGHNQGEIS